MTTITSDVWRRVGLAVFLVLAATAIIIAKSFRPKRVTAETVTETKAVSTPAGTIGCANSTQRFPQQQSRQHRSLTVIFTRCPALRRFARQQSHRQQFRRLTYHRLIHHLRTLRFLPQRARPSHLPPTRQGLRSRLRLLQRVRRVLRPRRRRRLQEAQRSRYRPAER